MPVILTRALFAELCSGVHRAGCVIHVLSCWQTIATLLEPHNLIVDRSLRREQADAQIIAARRYDTFWNTGEEALAHAALAPSVVDNTLPDRTPSGSCRTACSLEVETDA
jgi:hypothetical protein